MSLNGENIIFSYCLKMSGKESWFTGVLKIAICDPFEGTVLESLAFEDKRKFEEYVISIENPKDKIIVIAIVASACKVKK